MMCFRPDMKMLLVAGLMSAGPLDAAVAWEAEDVADRLKSLMAAQGVALDWAEVSGDGSSVVIEGVTAGPTVGGESIPLGTLTLEGVSEDDANYLVGHLGVDDYTFAAEGFSVTAEGVSISDMKISKEGSGDPLAEILLYQRFELAKADVMMGGSNVFAMSDLHAEMTEPAADGTMEFTGTVERFSVDLDTVLQEEAQRQTMEKLGYTQMEGRVDMAGSWRPSDGRTVISQYDFTVDNAGTLGIRADISGYTPEFIKTLREMQVQMEAAGEENAQAQGMAMLGLMQQLSFGGAAIRFADDSLTDKLLNFAAEQQGAQRSDFVSMAKVLLPMQLTPYLGAELTQSVTDAVTAFLNDPRNIEIRAEPAEPLPFAMLMGTAMGAPEALAKQVGLQVIANE